MNFIIKDKSTWERAEIFQHFVDNLRCVMSLTVEINITDFFQNVHQKQIDFYPAMIWVVSAAVNCREELRMGMNAQGEPGVWDVVSPYYTHFHAEDERFVKIYTEYSPDFDVFYQRYLEDKKRYQHERGFAQKEVPNNTFDVSCLPWAHYQHFDLHVFDAGMYLAPVVTWGKYVKDEQGNVTMPLTLNLHHAVADGYHLCRFFTDVENWMKKV